MTSKQVLLPLSSASVSVRVHPVALFSICDAYIRRNKDQERVIGTLLGTIVDNVYEVKNCYVVPHTETGDQVRACDDEGHSVRCGWGLAQQRPRARKAMRSSTRLCDSPWRPHLCEASVPRQREFSALVVMAACFRAPSVLPSRHTPARPSANANAAHRWRWTCSTTAPCSTCTNACRPQKSSSGGERRCVRSRSTPPSSAKQQLKEARARQEAPARQHQRCSWARWGTGQTGGCRRGPLVRPHRFATGKALYNSDSLYQEFYKAQAPHTAVSSSWAQPSWRPGVLGSGCSEGGGHALVGRPPEGASLPCCCAGRRSTSRWTRR